MLLSLFMVSAIYSFLSTLALPFLHINNHVVEAALSSYIVSSFITFTFFYLYILPRLNITRSDYHFIQQQIKGLNDVAIISTTDRAGNITYVNDNLCRISGYTKDELLGTNHRLIKSELHDKQFYKEMWQTISKGNIWQGQIKNKAKDGSEYWVFSNIIPLRNPKSGHIDEFISIRFDITHEKNLEHDLESEQAKNIHMGRLAAIGEMAGSVAHEINNPIAVIMGKIHILKRLVENIPDSELRESILSKMFAIEDHSKRITRIVKGLREFSHGGEANHQDEICSTNLFDSVLELCNEKLKINSVKVIKNCPEIKFNSPRLHLEQVLINLINNAVDAIADQEEKWIELHLSETSDHLIFTVTDSGAGIPADIVTKIMHPFFTTKPVGQGTGLGLSISKGLVEKMGGDFFYDQNSQNTCFKIIVPKNEKAIYSALPYKNIITNLVSIREKLECRLQMKDKERYEGEFSLKMPDCPLSVWLLKNEFRLGKNEDFKMLKSTYEQVRLTISDIEWKFMNKNLSDEIEILSSRRQMDDAVTAMIQKLHQIEEIVMVPKPDSDSENEAA